jgi:hypothetical protein
MKKLFLVILLFALLGPVIHAEYMVKRALKAIGPASNVDTPNDHLDLTAQQAADILFIYHKRAFYSQEEIELMSEIAAVEYAVWNYCGGISEEDTYSCEIFKGYLEVLEEELFWSEGLRPTIRLFWQERFELWQE